MSSIPFILIVIETLVGAATSACSNPIEAIGGGDQTVNISCRGAALPNNMARWMYNSAPITIDGVKFTTTPNGDRLTIRSVTGSDEGSYSCLYTNSQNQQVTDDSSCLFVLGRAVFTTCGNTQQMCREEIDFVVGRSILFDTRLSYLDAGRSNMRQVTYRLFLRKGDSRGNYAVCTNRTNRCIADPQTADRLNISNGNHLFDVNITINNATPEDAGNYTAVVEVKEYVSGSTIEIAKTFTTTLKCPDLLDPDNGRVMVTPEGNHPNNSVAHYNCNQPYTLSGNSRRTCQSNGQWSGNEPTCVETVSPTQGTLAASLSHPTHTSPAGTTNLFLTSSKTTTPTKATASIIIAVTIPVILILSTASVIAVVVVVVVYLTLYKHHVQSESSTHKVQTHWSPETSSLHCEGNEDSKLDETFKGQCHNV